MLTILSKLGSLVEVLFFTDDTILNKPIEEWPVCDALISFHSKGFPLAKVPRPPPPSALFIYLFIYLFINLFLSIFPFFTGYCVGPGDSVCRVAQTVFNQ
jgi:hypothetical protein